MSNLGYHYIFRSLKENGVSVERFFTSPHPYRSVEGDTLLERFETIMASISYEGDVPKFAHWLANAGIKPSRRARGPREPVVCAGGAITYINPLSLSDLADFIVLGDGVPVLPFIVEQMRCNAPKEQLLEALAEHASIFVPSIHLDRGKGARLERSADEKFSYGISTWITPKTVFGSTCLLEMQRGCARNCKYCTLPTCFSPFRQRGFDDVKNDLEMALQAADFDQVGLVTPEASDYIDIDKMLDFIESKGKGISFASLRVDALTERMIEALTAGGRRSITVAPETGDDALRTTTGKKFTNADVMEKLLLAKKKGIRSVKLYFMIGLPNEKKEDIEAIGRLCEAIKSKTGLLVHAAVSPFIPKPGTIWEMCDFESSGILRQKSSILKKFFRNGAAGTLQIGSLKEAAMEYAISWASADSARGITERAVQKGHAKPGRLKHDKDSALRELGELGLKPHNVCEYSRR